MRRTTISTALQAPSIVIVQGAYENFCGPSESPAVYDVCRFAMILVPEEPIGVSPTYGEQLRFMGLVDSWQQERGEIMPRRISGISAKDQRRLTTAIKRARAMAMLPFVAD